MYRIKIITHIILFLMTSTIWASEQPYIAFSLREAQYRLQFVNEDHSLHDLGGITRVIGMVYDRQGGDIILVGRAIKDLPKARFDDLVVALRTRLIYDKWPMVSIDPTEETIKTGLQKVNFGGSIEKTSFGNDFLNCDIILKNYSLELVPQIDSVPSYKYLCFNSIKSQIEKEGAQIISTRWLSADSVKNLYGKNVKMGESYQTRFWFFPLEPFRFVAREEVFCIKELRLGVKLQLIHTNKNGSMNIDDESNTIIKSGRLFSIKFTDHFPEMTEAYPLLKRLKILYDFVAVAEGIRNIEHRPDLEFLLHKYKVPPVRTKDNHELVEIFAVVDRSDKLKHAIQISGGIQFRTELKWLNYGDVIPLKEIVIKSRPSPNTLIWTLPLESWNMPNSNDLETGKVSLKNSKLDSTIKDDIGFTITTQSCIVYEDDKIISDNTKRFQGFLPPPPPPPQELGGVDIDIKPSFLEKKLDTLKTRVIESRTSKDSLFWNIKKRK